MTLQDKKVEYFYGPYSKDYLWALMTMNTKEGMTFDQEDYKDNQAFLWSQLTNFIVGADNKMFKRIVDTLVKDKKKRISNTPDSNPLDMLVSRFHLQVRFKL